MRRVSALCGMFLVVCLALGAAAPAEAQQVAVVRVQSLDAALADIEAVAQAAGQPLNREAMVGMALGGLGITDASFLDFARPLVVTMPVEGMALQQKGLVGAVPVSDAAAAMSALSTRFGPHTEADGVHSFGGEDGAILHAVEKDGYLIVGGSADLVQTINPLDAGAPEDTISVEVFLEPIAPMLQAGLQAGQQKMRTELEGEDGEDVGLDTSAVSGMLDLYMDGVQALVANTSSLQMALNVDDGAVRYTLGMVPTEGSGIAQFVASQKGDLPELARLVDASSAGMFMAGQLNLSGELRAGLKDLVESYMGLMTGMFDMASEATAADATSEAPAEGETADTTDPELEKMRELWAVYTDVMSATSDRWVECFRGDMAMTYGFDAAGKLSFTQASGLTDPETCHGLMSEMAHQFEAALAAHEELADLLTVSEGPRIGDVSTEITTVKIGDLMAAMPSADVADTEEVEAALTSIYGDEMVIATAEMEDVMLMAGGGSAIAKLEQAVARVATQPGLPSFAPIRTGPGYFGVVDIGRFMEGFAAIAPEARDELGGMTEAFAPGVHRIPFGLRFEPSRVAFEMAVPLATVEAIATYAAEQSAGDEELPMLEEVEPEEPEEP